MTENEFLLRPISVEALKAGDKAECARCVEQHSTVIYRLGLRMLGDERDAEDILQETFIKAFQHIGDFDGRSQLSTWLYRIATNEALMLLRKRKPEPVSVEVPGNGGDEGLEEPLQIEDWTNLPEEELLSSETQAFVNQAVNQLPEGLREVFWLREMEGLSTQETAQVLNISESAAKTRLSRARLQLREELTRYYGERLRGKVHGTR
jgi:RNA polymerase sigma-70 factor (ECF subfamily)